MLVPIRMGTKMAWRAVCNQHHFEWTIFVYPDGPEHDKWALLHECKADAGEVAASIKKVMKSMAGLVGKDVNF